MYVNWNDIDGFKLTNSRTEAIGFTKHWVKTGVLISRHGFRSSRRPMQTPSTPLPLWSANSSHDMTAARRLGGMPV